MDVKWNFYYRDNDDDWVNITDYILDIDNILDKRLESFKVVIDTLAFPDTHTQEFVNKYRLQLYTDDFYFKVCKTEIRKRDHLIVLTLCQEEKE